MLVELFNLLLQVGNFIVFALLYCLKLVDFGHELLSLSDFFVSTLKFLGGLIELVVEPCNLGREVFNHAVACSIIGYWSNHCVALGTKLINLLLQLGDALLRLNALVALACELIIKLEQFFLGLIIALTLFLIHLQHLHLVLQATVLHFGLFLSIHEFLHLHLQVVISCESGLARVLSCFNLLFQLLDLITVGRIGTGGRR